MLKSKLIKRAFALLLIIVMASSTTIGFRQEADAAPVATATPIYKDTSYSFAERAADMVARLTLQQKADQMRSVGANSVTGNNPVPAGNDNATSGNMLGTGIRGQVYWGEALHGWSRSGVTANATGFADGANTRQTPRNAVSYPISYSMGQTWDPDLMYRISTEIGMEARERSPGFELNLNFYSPTVNLSRDPRWGRNTESYGEDPVHSAMIAAQFVNGFQGFERDGKTLIDPNGYWKANTTLKHYLANNSENNRTNGTSNMTEQEHREYYGKVYREILKQADPSGVMSSYNRIQIEHAAYAPGNLKEQPGGVNIYTLDTMLRQTYGFNGFVTSDCDSVGTALANHAWRTPAYRWYKATSDTAAAGSATITQSMLVAWAVMAGGSLQCNSGISGGSAPYNSAGNLPGATVVNTPLGRYTENAIDVEVAKILESRLRLGEWDSKTVYTAAPASAVSTNRVSWYDKARSNVQSYNLALPTVAGSATDPLQGVARQESMVLPHAIANPAGTTMTAARMELVGEAAGKALVLLKNENGKDGSPILPLKFNGNTGTVGVYGDMRHYDTGGNKTTVGSSTEWWMLGLYSSRRDPYPPVGNGYDIMVNPVQGITKAVAQKFGQGVTVVDAGATANAAASTYDYVIAVVGDMQYNASSAAQEGRDRAQNQMTRAADITLVKALYAANPNLIVVLNTSGPVGEIATNATTIDNAFASMPALLYSSYLGDRPGTGIGEVITGIRNPSARTAGTWYPRGTAIGSTTSQTGMGHASINQIFSYRLSPGIDGPWQVPNGTTMGTAITYNSAGPNRGRTYMYYNGTGEQAPLFPFGYGLSYTTFEYGALEVKVNGDVQTGTGTVAVNPNDEVEVSFKVTNTGNVAGTDIAQFYVKTPDDLYATSETGSKGQAYASKRLKDFANTGVILPGMSKDITLSVKIPDIAFWSNANKKFELMQLDDPYTLQISRSSADTLTSYGQNHGVQLSRNLTINNAANWDPKISVVSFKPNGYNPINNPNTTVDERKDDVLNNIPERLLYHEGDRINPNPTVAMANDVLYGTINRLYSLGDDQEYPIPANITITYVSNRNNVVRVNSDGTITAVSGGVATITGTATDAKTGSSAVGEFVVYVQGQPISISHALTMDSFTFLGEERDTRGEARYLDVHVPDSITNISSLLTPAYIKVTEPDKVDIEVSLSASGAVTSTPCVATVTITSKEDPRAQEIYTLTFGHMSLEWTGEENYMGYQTWVGVRFYDGVTELNLMQAWYDAASGRLKYVGFAEAQYNIPKHGSETLVAITHERVLDPISGGYLSKLPDELLAQFKLKTFLWDGNYVPLLPAQVRTWS